MSEGRTIRSSSPSNWWVLPALLVVVAGTLASNHDIGRAAPVLATLLAGSATLALLLAARAPVAALLANATFVGAYFALGYVDGPVFLVVPAATFLVAVQHPVRRWLYAAVGAVLLVAAGLLARGVWWDDELEKALWQSLATAAIVSAAGAVAVTVRGRRQTSAERAQRTAAEEQLRMAQDLHDGVGHGLAVIALQSGVALHLLDKDDIDRVAARRAIEVIRETSRESLESLRAELSRLAPGVSAPRTAHRGLAELPVLLDRFRAGGLNVELADGHDPHPIPDPVDEAAYGIVQEALTNVLRHSSGHRAVVELQTDPVALQVSITDDGHGENVVEGLGITGMRARAQRVGGSLNVGRTPEGFQVRAVLPLGGLGVIRVAVIDDQAVVRLGLSTLVGSEDDLDLVGEAADGSSGLAMIRRARPDVVLCDIRMPVMDGLAMLREVTADPALSGVRVVMLTTFELDEYVFEALRLGASGFLLKDADPDRLLDAIRVVADGGSLLAPSVTRRVIEHFGADRQAEDPHPEIDRLTEREREIVAWVATGRSNAEIADRLVVSPDTVRTHVSRAMVKLHARDRAQLVVFGIQSGLKPPTQSRD